MQPQDGLGGGGTEGGTTGGGTIGGAGFTGDGASGGKADGSLGQLAAAAAWLEIKFPLQSNVYCMHWPPEGGSELELEPEDG